MLNRRRRRIHNAQPRTAQRPAASFIFEQSTPTASFTTTSLQRSTALAALLLLALVLFLRVTVSQTRARVMTPILYGGFAAIILLGAWLLADTRRAPAARPAATATTRS